MALNNVGYTYPVRRGAAPVDALRAITIDIAPHERVALLGPNGSGKSTLFQIICGLRTPTSGRLAIFGQSVDRSVRARIGVVFQHPGLDATRTVRQNLRQHATLYDLPSAEIPGRIDAMCERFDLTDRRKARIDTLSGGWARRVDLCRALLHEPSLVLLDEPTVGLDPGARRQFLDQLDALRDPPCAMLMSTHMVVEAEQFDRVIFIDQGRIIADDRPARLRESLGARRLTVHDRGWTPEPDQQVHWTRTPDGWMRGDDGGETLQALAGELLATNVPFTVGPPSLDDAFATLTGRRLHANDVAPGAVQS